MLLGGSRACIRTCTGNVGYVTFTVQGLVLKVSFVSRSQGTFIWGPHGVDWGNLKCIISACNPCLGSCQCDRCNRNPKGATANISYII